MRGDLADTNMVDLCRGLAASGSTGELRISSTYGLGRVFLRDGSVVWADAPDARMRLAERLVSGGAATRPELAAVRARDPDRGSHQLAAALADEFRVSADALRVAVQEQTVDALTQLAGWQEGGYTFEAGGAPPAPAQPTLPVETVLAEVRRRSAEWQRVQETVRDLDLVLHPVPEFRPEVPLEPDEQTVLQAADGRLSVRGLADELGHTRMEAARVTAALVEIGAVTLVEPAEAAEPQPRAATPDGEAAARTDEAAARTDEAAAQADGAPPRGSAEEPVGTGETAPSTAEEPLAGTTDEPAGAGEAAATASAGRVALDIGATLHEALYGPDPDAEPPQPSPPPAQPEPSTFEAARQSGTADEPEPWIGRPENLETTVDRPAHAAPIDYFGERPEADRPADTDQPGKAAQPPERGEAAPPTPAPAGQPGRQQPGDHPEVPRRRDDQVARPQPRERDESATRSLMSELSRTVREAQAGGTGEDAGTPPDASGPTAQPPTGPAAAGGTQPGGTGSGKGATGSGGSGGSGTPEPGRPKPPVGEISAFLRELSQLSDDDKDGDSGGSGRESGPKGGGEGRRPYRDEGRGRGGRSGRR